MRRISNRRYPKRICDNPACGITFQPHDRRQIYCEEQCRINFNNDKRHIENNSRFSDEKQSRLNNKILASAWGKLKDKKEKHVERVNLEWDGFDFHTQVSIRQNKKTGRNILWYHDYGLELVDAAGTLFEIHKKLK